MGNRVFRWRRKSGGGRNSRLRSPKPHRITEDSAKISFARELALGKSACQCTGRDCGDAGVGGQRHQRVENRGVRASILARCRNRWRARWQGAVTASQILQVHGTRRS